MNIVRVENRLVIASQPIGVSVYDFDFDLNFRCTHPHAFDHEERCILRTGAVPDYESRFEEMLGWGLRLVNSPDEHALASQLEHWYPFIADLTPRTEVFDRLPSVADIEYRFSWPIFLKGSRQTSKHSTSLSVIENATAYKSAAEAYVIDDILHWQKAVVREFVPLSPVAGSIHGKIAPSLEYRSFWWDGRCVGWGRYWYQVPPYGCKDAAVGLAMAQEAARRLKVPFLVIDFAKTAQGNWIIIECNDGQESGYSTIEPRSLWNRVLFGDAAPA